MQPARQALGPTQRRVKCVTDLLPLGKAVVVWR